LIKSFGVSSSSLLLMLFHKLPHKKFQDSNRNSKIPFSCHLNSPPSSCSWEIFNNKVAQKIAASCGTQPPVSLGLAALQNTRALLQSKHTVEIKLA
jgi:hypothetical protein